MRKIIALVLAIALVMSMSLSSAATQPTEEQSVPVTAVYVPGEESGQIISVVIDWHGMDFTYNETSKPVWDADTHQYMPGSAASWAKSDAYVSITNHSNLMLQAVIEFSNNDGYDNMDLFFADYFPYIGSAETSDGEGEECTVTIKAVPMGFLTPDTPTDTNAGEILISMSPVTNRELIVSSIKEMNEGIPVKSEETTIDRGYPYFADDEIKQQLSACFTKVSTALSGTSEPAKNAALNELITTYYNNLQLMQD